MRRNLVIGLAVAMLCGVVFAGTLINQYTPPAPVSSGEDAAAGGPAVPLSFTSTRLFYAPGDDNIVRRNFEGFYEPSSSELQAAPFWFENPHTEPVTVTVRGRSCTACTSARLASIPAARVDELRDAVFADLALGANSPTGLAGALAAAGLMKGLDWKQLDFEKPNQGVVVPPAESPGRATWGVLQLEVKVALGGTDRSALVGTQLGARPMATQTFTVGLVGVSPFSLDQSVVDLGELSEGSGPRTAYVNVWSATRDADRFPPPGVAVASKDGLVQVGQPVPLTAEQMSELRADAARQKQSTRVRSGYRLPLTVYRRRPAGVKGEGPPEAEIGPFERTVQVVGPGGSAASFKVSGTVTGVVTLQDAAAIDVKDFNGKHGVTENFTLLSERPEVTLAVDGATTPSYLKVVVGEPGQFGPSRRRWQLSVTVPPEACYGDLPRDAAVVLTGTSAGEPFRVRLPVKGKGYRRGL